MKKITSLLIAILLCVLVFAGCEKPNADTGLPPFEPPTSEGVSSVSVSSLPEGYNYSFTGEAAKKVVDYFSEVQLTSKFNDNPNEMSGMTLVVSITYEGGRTETLYEFSPFIRKDGGSWYKIVQNNAKDFHTYLDELKREHNTDIAYSGGMVITATSLSNIQTMTESQLILDQLNNGEWIDDLCECEHDYTISLNGKALRYSSYCGTINNTTDGTSLTLSADEKASVNEYLESLFEGIDPSWE